METKTINQVNKKIDFKKALKIMFLISAIGAGIYVLLCIILACLGQDKIFAVIATNLFSDFAETLAYATVPNPYTGEYGVVTIYPPIAFLIFVPFTLFCRGALQQYSDGTITLQALCSDAGFVISFLLYYLINLAIIMYVVAKMSKLKGKDLVYLLTIIAVFGPLLFCFVRANNTLTTFVLVLLFFYLNSSDKIWKREVSYACLAGAVATKIFPILIVFYLIWKSKGLEKLWSVLKVLGYSLVFVFLPFLFIEGGFANISVLWGNFTGFSGSGGSTGASPTTWGTNISLETIIINFCALLSAIFGGADMSMLHSILSKVLRYGLLLIAIILPFVSFKSNKYKEFVTLGIGTYLLYPGVCNGYCLTLMIIPFVLTIIDWDSYGTFDKIFYAICYILIACPVFYTYGYFIPSAIATLAIVVKSIVDIIRDDVKIRKQDKLSNKDATSQDKQEAKEEAKIVETTAEQL